MQTLQSGLQLVLIYAIPILFAITVHEVAHGWVANRLGDPTAKLLGRLTLNPIKHIDPIGTVLVPLLLLLIPGIHFIFGWAKPVPIDWQKLKNPSRDMALVAAAGPLANVIMAIIWFILLKISMAELTLTYPLQGCILSYLEYAINNSLWLLAMSIVGVSINTVLFVLNLLPLPPLDGSRIVSSLLPPKARLRYNQLEPFGFIIILLLLFTQVLQIIMMMPLAILCDWLHFGG